MRSEDQSVDIFRMRQRRAGLQNARYTFLSYRNESRRSTKSKQGMPGKYDAFHGVKWKALFELLTYAFSADSAQKMEVSLMKWTQILKYAKL